MIMSYYYQHDILKTEAKKAHKEKMRILQQKNDEAEAKSPE